MPRETSPRNGNRSVNRTDIQKYIDQLLELFQREEESKWEIGDLFCLLIEEKGVKVRDLARWLNRFPSTISEYHHTAQSFPKDSRNPEVPFSRYIQACRMVGKFHLEPMEALDEIQKNNLNQSRDVTRYFADRERVKQNAQAKDRSAAMFLGKNDLINHCHLADCLEVIPRLADHTVKICFFDPPYGKYLDLPDGRYGESGATPCDCDNATTQEAMELIKRFLPAMEPKLAGNGVILLFRPSGNIDPHLSEIQEAVKQAGLVIQHEPIWDKGTSKLGNGKSPYTVGSERIWVIKRQGDELMNHDGSSTSDILRFAPVHQGSDREGNNGSHYFMKPSDLCEFLIKKHSYEGELVFEPCGCTGNFCIAACRLNRNFVYCESDAGNFDAFSPRIYQTLAEGQMKAGLPLRERHVDSSFLNKEQSMKKKEQNPPSNSGKPLIWSVHPNVSVQKVNHSGKKDNSILFSSRRQDWETPPEVFDPLNEEFKFTVDACATAENTKCRRYFSPEQDGLKQSWRGEVVWMNPPYKQYITDVWMEKAYKSSLLGATVVCLVAARTSNDWWHDYAMKSSEIRYILHRVRFLGGNYSATFPSVIVIFEAKPYPAGDLEYELSVWGEDRISELAPWMIPYAIRRGIKQAG